MVNFILGGKFMFSWIFAIPAILILAVVILLSVLRGTKKSCARLVTLLLALFVYKNGEKIENKFKTKIKKNK